MRVTEIYNNLGEALKTKEGKAVTEIRLDAGDEFIPVLSKVMERANQINVTEKGKTVKKTIVNYYIKAIIRDTNKKQCMVDGQEELFICLTPGQAKSMINKAKELQINEHLWHCYTYKHPQYGEQLGVGLLKERTKKSFNDFEPKPTENNTSEAIDMF